MVSDETDESTRSNDETSHDEDAPVSSPDYDCGATEPGPVPLFQLFRWIDAHGITAYKRPASLTPEPEMDETLVAAIVADLAEGRPEGQRLPDDVLADIRLWCDENPALPPAPPPPPPVPRPLSGLTCCVECPTCAANPEDTLYALCNDCLRRRLECQAKHVVPFQDVPPAVPPPIEAAKLRVASDLRRIGIGLFELSGAVRHNVIWAVRHGVAAAERQMEKRGEAVASGVAQAVDRHLVDPLVVRIMRLAARLDGGFAPQNATREAVLSMVYGPDRRAWPTWIKLQDL